MLVDARTLPTGEVIEADVCIIGAGPAGVTIAREFVGQAFRVCLLESGGVTRDDEVQSLCQGNVTEGLYQDLCKSRHRQFGGTANEWHIEMTDDLIGGRCGPLEAIDFEAREGVPYSGWPFPRSHLEPFYQRAQEICQLGPFAYDAADWEDAQTRRLPFKSDRVTTAIYQFTPRSIITQRYRDEIQRAGNITTYLYATVVEIETNDSHQTATRVRVATLTGNTVWVTARIFILAIGGIENARLLLTSNTMQSTGLGNQNDLVGRFFMDHPGATYMFYPAHRGLFNKTALYDLRRVKDVFVKGKLVLSQATKRQENLLNGAALIHPRPRGFRAKSVQSLKTLVTSVRHAKLPQRALQHVGTVISGLDDVVLSAYRHARNVKPYIPGDVRGGWSHLPHKEQQFASFQVSMMVEQAPNPHSRVMLSSDRDRLGQPKVNLNWAWSDLDLYSIRRTYEIFNEELIRAGLGRLETNWQIKPLDLSDTSAHHHIGTTRMHLDPKQGVVDPNCRVHGMSNLFIAGSSVFPTGGYVNPTLTIIALAVRLADHVKQVMAYRAAQV